MPDFNAGRNYDWACTLNYCCTTPLPTNGVGNISSDPQLASASHLSPFSPCIGQGNYAAVSGVDIDGEPWANPPSIGCDEYQVGGVSGPLSVAITVPFTNVAIGYPVDFTALIEGRTDLSIWEFGDGALEINQPYTAHSWAMPGDYLVSLWAFNDSYPGGVSAAVTVHVGEGLHYVAANNANPVMPYTSWTTAATSIQDAINVAEPGAQVVVTNGSYAPIGAYGALLVRSVNGALFTIIDGGNSRTCAALGNEASLSGFTLTNGSAAANGGGAAGGTLNNCILSGNSAENGGAASGSTLNNCALIGNWAHGYSYGGWYFECHRCDDHECCGEHYFSFHYPGYGGAAHGCTLNNCTLAGNSSDDYGGGAANCALNNCVVYFNTAQQGANYFDCILSYCCTTPQPTNGLGNITSAPLFLDMNGWANLRLQSNSPCINVGSNSYVTNATDLDGRPRIVSGTVDIGAYEFQPDISGAFIGWLQNYGLPTDGSTDTADPDGDRVDNYNEWLAGTNPTNRFSSPAQLTIVPSGTNVILTWPTNAVGFTLQSTTNLVSPGLWSTNSPAPVVIAGQNTVTNSITGSQQFYRLVQ